MGLSGESVVVATPHHVSADMGEEIILLHLENGLYFGLGNVGTRIWKLLQKPLKVREITSLLTKLGIDVNVTAPMGASPADIARLGEADFNVVLYPEIAGQAASWLQRTFGQPFTKIVPIGVSATREFVAEVAKRKSRSLQVVRA